MCLTSYLRPWRVDGAASQAGTNPHLTPPHEVILKEVAVYGLTKFRSINHAKKENRTHNVDPVKIHPSRDAAGRRKKKLQIALGAIYRAIT